MWATVESIVVGIATEGSDMRFKLSDPIGWGEFWISTVILLPAFAI